MSTRVHELAKELGLKSAELLERIQSWGLDVKASNFASLDPATVDRIRELSATPKSGQAPASRSTTESPSSPPPSSVPPVQPARPGEFAGSAPAAKSVSATPTSPAQQRVVPAGFAPARRRAALGPGQQPVRGYRPVDHGIISDWPRRNRTGCSGLAVLERRAAGTGGVGPLGSSWWFFELACRERAAVGTYSASRDRTAPGRLVFAVSGRPAGAEASQPGPSSSPGTGAPPPGGFQPLKPGDYMSSAGIRTMTPRVSPAPPASSASRRPAEGGGEGGRRDSGGIAARKGPPLPQVAAANAPRPAMSPRPSAPAPALKTQRPDKSMTREELLAMMRSGQLSNLQSPGGGAGAPGGPRPGHRPGLSSSSLRSGAPAPGGAPTARRGPAPAAPASVFRPHPRQSLMTKRSARRRPGDSGRLRIERAGEPGAVSAPASAASRLRSQFRRFWSTKTIRDGPAPEVARTEISGWPWRRHEKLTSRSNRRSPFEACPKRSESRPKIYCAS